MPPKKKLPSSLLKPVLYNRHLILYWQTTPKDSSSTLTPFPYCHPSKAISNLLNTLTFITLSKKLIFCWILIHIGIQGNHKADSVAKSTFNIIPDKNSKVLYTKLKPQIRWILPNKWQQMWKRNTNNKLY